MTPCHHRMPVALARPASDGVDMDEHTVRALIAIIGHRPGQPATWEAPHVPAEYDIEIRDAHDKPRPDWLADLSPADYRALAEQAAGDWQATVDAKLAEAAIAAADARHEEAVRGSRIGRVWV